MDGERTRKRLEHERNRLKRLLKAFTGEQAETVSETESYSELSSYDQHPADMGSETFERTKDLSIIAQIDAELEDVERAFRRLDNGTYGICEACGKAIEQARLEAIPTARFCVSDQARAEREAAGSV
ncbi:MAG TPA: TraR/DksA C4-type zinc finger protein [Actinomycetota bacterium]